MTREQNRLPILPLRDVVLFPHAVKSFYVGRPASVAAIEQALKSDGRILVLTQRDPEQKQLRPEDLYEVGTVAKILMNNPVEEGMIKVSLRGQERARIEKFVQDDPFLEAEMEVLWFGRVVPDQGKQRQLTDALERYAAIEKKFPQDLVADLQRATDLSRITDLIANFLPATTDQRQDLLEMIDPGERADVVTSKLLESIEVQELERTIKKRVKKQMERNQREYYLNEKMKAIQKELGQDTQSELEELQQRIKDKKLPGVAAKRAEAEVKKLGQMSPMSAEATVVRTYLDWLLALPWENYRALDIDLERIKEQLDVDHFGLEEVKDRILEQLAVHKLSGSLRGPKLLFVGPPGVGKTSLAKSIAKAMDLEFIRHSLGGVRDEAEIRGHRRTYIGSMPGRIIQGLKKGESGNPVFLLDEIDKMGTDYRGDPSSALLEVLDPEQNDTFIDHYLDMEYDLSQVFFIATANSLSTMQGPLLDRMEVIELDSYTRAEKLEIARRHLVPRQLERQGLAEGDVSIEDASLRTLIEGYTKEAGVRGLERRIEELFRKVARIKVEAEAAGNTFEPIALDEARVRALLGPKKYKQAGSENKSLVGVTNGLAWTSVGGEILTIEVNLVPGTGKVTVTGKLGDVMKESAQAALSVVRKRAQRLGIDPRFYSNVDVHIHVPEGAVPKDGPSAGITMATALASELTGLASRADLAMTGEITLRGRVLPIGGLKEKLLAAMRYGIRTVLIPYDNEVDLEKVPDAVKDALEIVPVENIDQVLELALEFDAEQENEDLYHWLEAHPPVADYLLERPAEPVV